MRLARPRSRVRSRSRRACGCATPRSGTSTRCGPRSTEMQATADEADRDGDAPDADTIRQRPVGRALPGRRSAPAAGPPSRPSRWSRPSAPSTRRPTSTPDTEDPTPRPTIRVIGSPRPGRGGWHGDEPVEQSAPDDAARRAAAGARPAAAKRAYDAALALVERPAVRRRRSTPSRRSSSGGPTTRTPTTRCTGAASATSRKGDYPRAAEQFEGVLAALPGRQQGARRAAQARHVRTRSSAIRRRRKEYFDRLAQQLSAERGRATHPARQPSPATTPSGPAPEDHR